MKSNNFTDSLPHVTDSDFLVALLEVFNHFFEAEYRDFVTDPKPDHVVINMLILLSWLRDHTLERGEPPLRRVK